MKSNRPPPHHDAPDLGASQDSGAKENAVVREGSTYMTDPQAEQMCSMFGDGLASGIGYSRILDILARQNFDRKTVGRLRWALLENGDRLSEALARWGVLDPSARKLLLVAEEQGALPETFLQLSEIYGKRFKRKRDFAISMIEPLILVALGMIVFGNLIGSNIVDLAFSAGTADELGTILVASVLESAIFGAFCFAGFLTWLHLPVDLAFRDLFGRIWMRLPVISRPGRLYSVSIFCRYLRQSIDCGMTIHQGIELAAEAANHPGILGRHKAAQKRIDEGHSLAAALYAIPALPAEVLENIDIGEESGRIDERLKYLAERYDERSVESYKNRMKTYTWMIRYTTMVLVITAIFLSIASLNVL